ncbi:MAG: App1 family protein, partial [Actinomycetes bacterium]
SCSTRTYGTMGPVSATGRKLHRAARVEDRLHAVLERWLRSRGWAPRVVAYTGYGADGWVRVLARVLLAPPGTPPGELRLGRGWRRFLTATAAGVAVMVDVAGRRHEVTSDRTGYIDVVLAADLPPGWAQAQLVADGRTGSTARLRIVDPSGGLGVISDIDDTVIVTALPRPLLAAWNTFVRHETTRHPVRGMASLYREIERRHPDAPFVYLSTGAWNVAPVLEQFLARHSYPPGPLLLTDWGPTADGWFRSGREHKRRELRRLVDELPHIRWLLVGDDGQHDPELYAEAAEAAPDRIRAVAIRQLSPTEQVLTHGTPEPIHERGTARSATRPHAEVRAPDGFGLLAGLRSRGILRG